MSQPDERCISACREKDTLGIRHGWCAVCVDDLRRQWREETAGLELQITHLTALPAQWRISAASEFDNGDENAAGWLDQCAKELEAALATPDRMNG